MIPSLYIKLGAGIGLLLTGFAVGSQKEHRTHVILEGNMQKAFDKTVSDVRLKTEQAHVADLQNARAKEQAQVAVNQESSREYQEKLSELRSRYNALRVRPASTANSGSGTGTGMSNPATASGGSDGESYSDRLFRLAYAADENTLKLIALQEAVRKRDEAFNSEAQPTR